MDIKELKKLVSLCKREKINHLKMNGVELSFSDFPPAVLQESSDEEEVPDDDSNMIITDPMEFEKRLMESN